MTLDEARAQWWDHPDPYVVRILVAADDIDALGHANNVCYLRWLERCAWAHSAAVGYDAQAMVRRERAMAVRDVRMRYLAATYARDELLVGDWITASDGRLRVTRSFQIVRPADSTTVMRAEIDYVCINPQTGRPARMPAEYVQAYCLPT